MRRALRTAIPVLLSLAAFRPAAAQDAQYWTQQYGNQARLLGGNVVGGTADVSATYYNPGRLALIDTPELLLAGNVFEYTTVTIEGAVLDQRFTSNRFGSVPSLFAGQIRSLSRGDSRVAYSLLTRYSSQFRFDERRDINRFLPVPLDLATFSYSLDEAMSEYWGGLTWARKLGDRVGIGVTGYVAVRNHRSRLLVLTQAMENGRAGVAIDRYDFDYYHWGALAKIGLGADLGSWLLGVTVTTPNLKILGQGAIGLDASVVTQDLNGDDIQASRIISGYRDKLSSHYDAPASLAIGVSHRWDRTTWHVSAEWFAGVPAYTVLEGGTATDVDGTTVRDMKLIDERDAVLNFGVGLEHRFREDLLGYASFRTDFSSAERAGRGRATSSIWDMYHLTTGATFSALSSKFTLGLMYAFGSDELLTPEAVVPDDDGSGAAIAPARLKVSFRRLTGLLGFSFGF